MIKAPPWLFSAESDLYIPPQAAATTQVLGTVTSRYWGMVPPTALVHFVCTMARL